MECGCIPRGICMPHLTRQTRDCSGQHELCCINQHRHNNILVNVFSHQEKKVQNMFRHKKKHLFKPYLMLLRCLKL